MKILIAADMEGITGVVNWDQVEATHAEYPRFRRLMTGDVNAAIRGAYDAGADEVIVADGHDTANNILIEELDPRARLNTGAPRPLSMLQGLDVDISGVFFIGYHARAGTACAILDHTWSAGRVMNVWLNGSLIGEIGLNAAVCAHFGAPLLLLSGDQAACAEAQLLGPLETVTVKQAYSRKAAECLPPAAAQEMIYAGAKRALKNLQAGRAFLVPVEVPVRLAVEFTSSDLADRASLYPESQRLDGRRLEITAGDMVAAYRGFIALVRLSRE